jgi:hypothetical protein
MKVTRELFNDVMVPNYNPAAIIPVKGAAHGFGIKPSQNILILPVVLRLTYSAIVTLN